jgi:hypothetical protein
LISQKSLRAAWRARHATKINAARNQCLCIRILISIVTQQPPSEQLRWQLLFANSPISLRAITPVTPLRVEV